MNRYRCTAHIGEIRLTWDTECKSKVIARWHFVHMTRSMNPSPINVVVRKLP